MTSTHLLTLQEAADLLGKSTQTVRRLIKKGELVADRIETPQGFQYSLPRESLVNYLKLPRIALTDSPRDDAGELMESLPLRAAWLNRDWNAFPTRPPSQDAPIQKNPFQATQDFHASSGPIEKTPSPLAEPRSQASARNEVQSPQQDLSVLLERHHSETLGLLNLLENVQNHLAAKERDVERLSDQVFRLSILSTRLSSQLEAERVKNQVQPSFWLRFKAWFLSGS